MKANLAAKNYAAQWRKDHPEQFQDSQLSRRYGISYSIALYFYERQNGKCAICESELPPLFDSSTPRNQKSHVDHNHETGEVRGLLCPNCNHLIGHAKENDAILRKAIAYLNKHNS